ncbi:hypothetical protein J6590_052633 [Homalodisca vitripennis]|nr:hypothetical protein J6590_052633 [Homalodisca vitripennis]
MPYGSAVHSKQYELRQHKPLQELHLSIYKLKNEIGNIRTRIRKETETIFSAHGRKDGRKMLQERLTGHEHSSSIHSTPHLLSMPTNGKIKGALEELDFKSSSIREYCAPFAEK